jgi:branched-chain amino acid aminotransferase
MEKFHTPIPDSFLDGITRRTVIEIAKSKNIKVHERKIKPEELSNFVGCFLTGTAAEVTPVSCIAENQFKVCETIIDLNESYQALVRKKKQLNFIIFRHCMINSFSHIFITSI